MSDRGYAILVTAAKYVLINLVAYILLPFIARTGWITLEDTIIPYFLIINCTAIILGKLQKIEDHLKEIEKKEEFSKNNA